MEDGKKDVLRATDAEAVRLAKTLIRSARHGALAVIEPGTGAPLASRVGAATDSDGAPLILISALAAHTGALLAEPRCSLLLGEPGKGDPLAHPRIALSCRAVRLERETPDHGRAERRYLNRNPKARLYAGLGDFSFFRLEPASASLNGGFGRAYLLGRDDLLLAGLSVAELAAAEQAALDHMNADHADAIAAYARHFAKRDGKGWTMTGIDGEGVDLVRDDETARIWFPAPLGHAGDLRRTLVEMAGIARAAQG